MKLRVFATLNDEALEPWIWTNSPCITKNVFIKITCADTKKSVYCFKRTIDRAFTTRYNSTKSTLNINNDNLNLVISDYYRKRLGIETRQEYDFELTRVNFFIAFYYKNFVHPNPSSRNNNRIAFLSFLLGLLSLFLTLYFSCKETKKKEEKRTANIRFGIIGA